MPVDAGMPLDGDVGGLGMPVDGGSPGGRGMPAGEGAPGGDGGRGTPGVDGGATGADGGWAGVPGADGGFWAPSPLPKNLLKKLSLSLMVHVSEQAQELIHTRLTTRDEGQRAVFQGRNLLLAGELVELLVSLAADHHAT